jgi:hypothetical protein
MSMRTHNGGLVRTNVDHKLQNLQNGNIPLPPDADPARALEVVPVHDDVDGQIECNGHPGDGSAPDQFDVAEEGCCAVVVGVQEGQRLLLEDEEDCVGEFEVFC